ncbi:MAG: hypothetical protein Q4A41_01055 [Bacillota bacterium]|nr:hypothetical protein [Bacillota bacterium]
MKYWEKINSNKKNRLYLRYQEEENDYLIVFEEKSSKRVTLITAFPVFFRSAKRDYDRDYLTFVQAQGQKK